MGQRAQAINLLLWEIVSSTNRQTLFFCPSQWSGIGISFKGKIRAGLVAPLGPQNVHYIYKNTISTFSEKEQTFIRAPGLEF